jgi:hypothetical protein
MNLYTIYDQIQPWDWKGKGQVYDITDQNHIYQAGSSHESKWWFLSVGGTKPWIEER